MSLAEQIVVCVGAFGKGRSSSSQLNQILRTCLGWSVLGNKELKQLYIASADNPADDPTRNVPLRQPQPVSDDIFKPLRPEYVIICLIKTEVGGLDRVKRATAGAVIMCGQE